MDTLYVSTQKTFWDSLPTWLSAIGTLFAVITSLYLSRKGDRLKALIIIADPPYDKTIWISITNIGHRSFTLNGHGIMTWKSKKALSFLVECQTLAMDKTVKTSTAMPVIINEGESVSIRFPWNEFEKLINNIYNKPSKYFKKLIIHSMKYFIYTSQGKIMSTRLPKNLRFQLSRKK